MSAFTPGPWAAEPDGSDAFRIMSDDFGKIAFLHDPTGEAAEMVSANARLIAAAPEMAELLASAIQVLEARAPDFNELNGNIRALLSKVSE